MSDEAETKRADRAEARVAELEAFIDAGRAPLRPHTFSHAILSRDGKTELTGAVVFYSDALAAIAAVRAHLLDHPNAE